MNPGPELDKLVYEIVEIRPSGLWPGIRLEHNPYGTAIDDRVSSWRPYMAVVYPAVSTSLGECEPVLEWLYQNTINLQYNFSEDRFICDDYELPCGQNLQHAACLAVLAINEGRKK